MPDGESMLSRELIMQHFGSSSIRRRRRGGRRRRDGATWSAADFHQIDHVVDPSFQQNDALGQIALVLRSHSAAQIRGPANDVDANPSQKMN